MQLIIPLFGSQKKIAVYFDAVEDKLYQLIRHIPLLVFMQQVCTVLGQGSNTVIEHSENQVRIDHAVAR